jgi:hypothetical protein
MRVLALAVFLVACESSKITAPELDFHVTVTVSTQVADTGCLVTWRATGPNELINYNLAVITEAVVKWYDERVFQQHEERRLRVFGEQPFALYWDLWVGAYEDPVWWDAGAYVVDVC